MKIFVVNSPWGRKLAKRVLEILRDHGKVNSLTDHQLVITESDNWVICAAALEEIKVDQLLVVALRDAPKLPAKLRCDVLLIPSDAEISCQGSASVITYGQLGKDTITLSSVDRDEAVVDLQRQILTLSGNTIEPCEIVVKVREQLDNDFILAVASILILTDNVPLLQYIII